MMQQYVCALLAATAFAAGGGDYDYKKNGADWGDIEGYGLCKIGKQQSPIDLTTDTDTSDKMNILGLNYWDFRATTADMSGANRAWTTPMVCDGGATCNAELQTTYADESRDFWTPLQFHFHAPSEHSVDGKLYDAEVHFVHYRKDSETVDDDGNVVGVTLGAVVGIFFDVEEGGDAENAFLASIFNSIDGQPDEDDDEDARRLAASSQPFVGLRQFLNNIDMVDFWQYKGSLTTPPCTEGIRWNVVKQVQPISKAQLAKFT